MDQDAPVVDKTPAEAEANAATVAPKVSPAQDLRDLQALLVNGIFPGNMAPAITKAYTLLEKMAQQVESEAKKDA